MAVIRWTPRATSYRNFWTDWERLRNQMENLMGAVGEGVDVVKRWGTGVYPALNMSEDSENLYLTAELPGVSPQDVELSIQADNLTLRGERKIPETDQKVSYHRREREAGTFRRVLSLPVKIDADKVTAKANDGVLTVTMPKAMEAKPRQISIQGV
jgi:HSP20 family protein